MKSLLLFVAVLGITMGGVSLWDRIRWAKKKRRYIAAWKDLQSKCEECERDQVVIYQRLIDAAKESKTLQEFVQKTS